MQKDHFTIVVFPGALGSPKKISLPKKLAKIIFITTGILFVTFLGSSVYFVQQYLKLQGNEIDLAKLHKESKIIKIQIEKFSHNVKNFETKITLSILITVLVRDPSYKELVYLRAILILL